MKSIQFALVSGLFLLLCHCGISPQALCKTSTTTVCKKLIECTPQAVKDLTVHLKDQAACETKFNEDNKCSASSICEDGKKYNAANAQKCIDEFNAIKCDDLAKASEKAPSCEKVCE